MTDQEKREKVISGLECCITLQKYPDEFDSGCFECPYRPIDKGTCLRLDYMLSDVLALLKAQEARLVVETDFENADGYGFLPVWVEDKGDSEIVCDCIMKAALADMDSGYHYRYWTSRPTDEQREAIPWE